MHRLRPSYLATAALSGALFGAGLYVSQMVDPTKVLRFLDFTAIPTGDWDPSLAFVIVPAILVMFVAVKYGRKRAAPLFDIEFHEPEYHNIDRRLIIGAALFGVGWGMSGLCPGPAISLVAFLPNELWIFLVTLFIGSYAGSAIVPSGHAKRLANAQ
ncbi:YeeE/YedE family protein [Devosia algicola]|uniref:YeeE/YedE family protein n=1 Tax=Devosia algicola TaxID=3026418 RepID=A0ABY7YPW8_9HYPH|nr:DUF6691 family protein [Devosia algicola]WDR03368.1 YeeE/YedE family protein [Devosia algicola]